LRKFFGELFEHVLDITMSGIQLPENLMFHDRSKHIEIIYRYIWDMVQRGSSEAQTLICCGIKAVELQWTN